MREYEPMTNGNHEPLWSFIIPVIADESSPSTQLFFQQKPLLNAASMPFISEINTNLRYLEGSFFKSTAKELDLESLAWMLESDSTMVIVLDELHNVNQRTLIRSLRGTMQEATSRKLLTATERGRNK